MTPKPHAPGLPGPAETAKGATGSLPPSDAPMVFLAGPPGSGKTTLGQRACAEFGLRFADLADGGRTDATLQALVESRDADVVALPWSRAHDARRLALCRQAGKTVALWAHPLAMQARSGRTEALFTPVRTLRTHGGFGQRGTRCPEYRRLARACEHVLMLVGLPEDDASEELRELIRDLRSPGEMLPAAREGLLGWRDGWRDDCDADAEACEVLVDAMARFTLNLKGKGTSPRKLAGVYSDLDALGFLTFCYQAPEGPKILDAVAVGPIEYEFRRKFSDSPSAWRRFRSTQEAFATFLRDAGMLGDDWKG